MESGAPGVSRTRDPLLRRQMLYPTELRAQPENQALASAGLNGRQIVPRNRTPLNEEHEIRSLKPTANCSGPSLPLVTE